MNFFNRLVMLIIALLMIIVPAIMLLVAFDHVTGLSADLVNQYTNYRSGLEALGNIQISAFDQQVRIIILVVSILVALVALILLLRELSFGRRVARDTVVEGTPGQETVIKTSAVQSLVEGAAREAGARSPNVSLSTEGSAYNVRCRIQIPESGNFTEIATRSRENIQNALNRYSVSHEEVEVTVQGTES